MSSNLMKREDPLDQTKESEISFKNASAPINGTRAIENNEPALEHVGKFQIE